MMSNQHGPCDGEPKEDAESGARTKPGGADHPPERMAEHEFVPTSRASRLERELAAAVDRAVAEALRRRSRLGIAALARGLDQRRNFPLR